MTSRDIRGFLFFDELTSPIFWIAIGLVTAASLFITYLLVTEPVSARLFYHHQALTVSLICTLYRSFSCVLGKWKHQRSMNYLWMVMKSYLIVFTCGLLPITAFLMNDQEPLATLVLISMITPWVAIWWFMLVMVYTYLFSPIRK